jgi:stage II sporulation protein D
MKRKGRNLTCKKGGLRLRGGLLLALVLVGEGFLFPLALLEEESQSARPLSSLVEALGTTGTTSEPQEDTAAWDQSVQIQVLEDGTVTTMTLGDYLWGVVAAEMPAAFELEALKAQAVAARSETLYRKENPTSAHPQADICTDSTCCQAYLPQSQREEKWGDQAEEYTEKITQAVTETDGQVVTYQGEVIQAVFHASSDGHTLSASQVWGGEVAYLQGVDSPEGEEVPNYYSVVTVEAQEFRRVILGEAPQAQLDGEPESWSITASYWDSGDLRTLTIGGAELSATRLRTLFSLRSARFTVEVEDSTVTFYVTGYGHGVGMSQYGANAMAKSGSSYEEILTWYYTGVEIETRNTIA